MDQYNITVTNAAFDRVVIMKKKPGNSDKMLRIRVDGGGCGGFTYNYSMTDKLNDDDVVFQSTHASIVIDKGSCQLLQNAIIDFIDELEASYFSVMNPQAKTKCGCGNSFSL